MFRETGLNHTVALIVALRNAGQKVALGRAARDEQRAPRWPRTGTRRAQAQPPGPTLATAAFGNVTIKVLNLETYLPNFMPYFKIGKSVKVSTAGLPFTHYRHAGGHP